MPVSDAELLETLLTTVLRVVAAHGDGPVGPHAGDATHPDGWVTVAETALLIELLPDPGAVTQQQLAGRLNLDKSRVSRLCAQLEEKGLLARDRDDANRRNLRVRLTGTGRDTAARLKQAVRARHERILAAMTQAERAGLLLGLGALVREFGVLHGADSAPRY